MNLYIITLFYSIKYLFQIPYSLFKFFSVTSCIKVNCLCVKFYALRSLCVKFYALRSLCVKFYALRSLCVKLYALRSLCVKLYALRSLCVCIWIESFKIFSHSCILRLNRNWKQRTTRFQHHPMPASYATAVSHEPCRMQPSNPAEQLRQSIQDPEKLRGDEIR